MIDRKKENREERKKIRKVDTVQKQFSINFTTKIVLLTYLQIF